MFSVTLLSAKSILPLASTVTFSRRAFISDFLRSIKENQRQDFLDQWNADRCKRERIYISYDSTNKNCQAGDIDIVEFGAWNASSSWNCAACWPARNGWATRWRSRPRRNAGWRSWATRRATACGRSNGRCSTMSRNRSRRSSSKAASTKAPK